MIISLIVAASENNVIGKNNQLPWHLPNDLRFFKNKTWGMPIIMGRKTFESINKPLPGRFTIIITRQKDWGLQNIIIANNLQDAITKAKSTNCKELFIAGGGEIFKQAIEFADKIYLTKVHANIEGDIFFPEISKKDWQLTSNEDFEIDKNHTFAYSFQILEKIR